MKWHEYILIESINAMVSLGYAVFDENSKQGFRLTKSGKTRMKEIDKYEKNEKKN